MNLDDLPEDFGEVIREAKEILDKHGHITPEMLTDVINSLPEEQRRGLALAVGLAAAVALLLKDQRFVCYNSKADKYFEVRVTDKPPEDMTAAMLSIMSGETQGYVMDGVRVDTEGVHVPKVCLICGSPTCDDPSACKQRQDMLAAIRSMGRPSEPQDGLKDVDS